MRKVQLTTDGSCLGNPGPGGWACILRLGTHEREMSGGAAQTTNNRMELTAAIEGLRALREPCHVEAERLEEQQAGSDRKPRLVGDAGRSSRAARDRVGLGAGSQRPC